MKQASMYRERLLFMSMPNANNHYSLSWTFIIHEQRLF